MNTPRLLKLSLLTLGTACAITATASAQVLLNDTFNRTTLGPQNLPASGQWFASNNSHVSVGDGKMHFDTNGAGGVMATVYFTNTGPITLEVGQQLTVSYTFTATGIDSSRGYLRAGVFNANGRRFSPAGLETGSGIKATNETYRGYASFYNIGTGTSDGEPNGTSQIQKRIRNATGLLNSATPYDLLTQGDRLSMANNTIYTGTIILQRTAENEMVIKQSMVGGSVNIFNSATDSGLTDARFFAFDTFSIMIQEGFAATMDISNVKVELAQIPIPEPASMAATIAGLLLAGAFLKRRINRK